MKHNQLCNFVAEEFNIRNWVYKVILAAEKQFNWKSNYKYRQKSIADSLGFKATMYNNETTIKCMEAKYSLSDFRNGFCIGGEYNYLIAPEGVIPIKEVPPFTGVIEIDFDNFYYNGNKIKGYKTAKRARKINIADDIKYKQLEIMKWRMLYKLTENIFENHWLDNINLKEKYGNKFNQGVMGG